MTVSVSVPLIRTKITIPPLRPQMVVRALSDYDRVEILCHDESVAENARTLLAALTI